MNKWIKKSIEIANSPGYLDRLQSVYPVMQETEREIDANLKTELKQLYDAGNNLKLIKKLLDLSKFPIKDPYVAFLRKNDVFLNYNPKTVDRIAESIRSKGFESMMEAISEPKEFNRQIGVLFKRWIPGTGYPMLPEAKFKSHNKE